MQPDDLAAVADVVAQAIQDALQPVLERLAIVEASLGNLTGEGEVLMALRERLAVVETKALQPPPPDPLLDRRIYAVDARLTPVVERVAATEARIQTLGDLRDRVVVLETKTAAPAPPVDLGDVRDRLVALETAALTPGLVQIALTDLRDRLTTREQTSDKDVIRLEGYTAALQRDASALSARVAVVETRAPVPGPSGKDGLDGRHGADGLGWDDLCVVYDGDRTFTFQVARGDQRKDVGTFAVPYMIYRGVFQEGRTYSKGDMVTWAGSLWLVNESTAVRPDDLSKAWTLCVKRGRDGRDGKDAPGALPVVSVGGGR